MKKFIFLICLSLWTVPSFSQWEEQDVKFLLLKKFVTQIEWPSNFNKKEFKFGVYGGLELYKKIAQMDIRPSHAGTQTVSYYYLQSLDNLVPCNIIYVPKEYTEELPLIKEKLHGLPILLISESPNGLKEGAMINFVHHPNGNVGYEVDKKSMQKSGLHFSYKILEGSTYAN